MKSYKPSEVRVIGMFGHRGVGKTSLAESLLFESGVTKRLGSVEDGNLALEMDEVAKDRQTTMQTNAGFCEYSGRRLSLLDTPGDSNFWAATLRATAVVDSALIVVSSVDGVETMTLRTKAVLEERSKPFAVVMGKLDKDGADWDGVLGEIQNELSPKAVALCLPLGSGSRISGVVNLLSGKVVLSDGKAGEIPADLTSTVETARELLFDAVAAADDDLAEKYLEEGSLSEEDLQMGLRSAFRRGELVPVLAAVPTSKIGVSALLDIMANVFPSPLEIGAVKGFRGTDEKDIVERIPSEDGPVVARVFRTYYDPFAGMLSYARVFSGTIHASDDLWNASRQQGDRPSHLYLPQGGTKTGVEIKNAKPGDIVALTKLKNTGTGDTLTSKEDPIFLTGFNEPEALLNYGISVPEQKEEDKVSSLIHKLVEEDPSLRFDRDPESNEMLLGGLGQAHIDYVVERLSRAGLKVRLQEPRIPYRETVRTSLTGIEGKHKKQSGGHGQFGVCFINVDPLPRGSGIEFVDQIVGGAIPRGFIPSVEKGIRDTLKGPLSGSEVVDLRITLYDGKYHRVDSSDMAFQTAGRKAAKSIFESSKAKPVLLEPYMQLDISCPADNVGDVMGDLNSRRARVNNMTTEGRRGRIDASVPMNEILKYTNVLKSLTSGRGSFTMHFSRYEEAPPSVQQQVTAAFQKAQESDS